MPLTAARRIEAGAWAVDEAEAWLDAHTRAHSFERLMNKTGLWADGSL